MPDMPTLATVPWPAPGFALEELDGELLLFNATDGRLLELNATAALVWQLCDGTRTVQTINALLVEAYPEAAQTIAKDIPAILANLRDLGALAF